MHKESGEQPGEWLVPVTTITRSVPTQESRERFRQLAGETAPCGHYRDDDGAWHVAHRVCMHVVPYIRPVVSATKWDDTKPRVKWAPLPKQPRVKRYFTAHVRDRMGQ